ncbi:MAG: hypothetical protein VW683_09620 [Betaproteobacteria bacterium]
MDNGSIHHWNHEDGTSTSVGDMIFYEPHMSWLVVDEITMEPVSGDPDELVYEPAFWCSNNSACNVYHFSASEINDLMRNQ